MKLGVYVCSYKQPVFLRTCLLQILHQSRRPDVLAVHENGQSESYRWAVEDVLTRLTLAGTQVIYHHTPHALPMPTFFVQPLQVLLDVGCDYINKVDVDDILYHDHFSQQTSLIMGAEYDFAMNSRSELLVLLNSGGYKCNLDVDFGTWNPTGAHPNCIIFNRAVAQDLLNMLQVNIGMHDDSILREYVFPKYKGALYSEFEPTMCYVAHGKNVSTAHWSDNPPLEVL